MTSSAEPERTPPGYAPRPPSPSPLAIAFELYLGTAGGLLALDQILVVQPDLYTYDGMVPSKAAARAGLAACGALGWLALRSISASSAWRLASVGIACAGFGRFLSFALGHWANAAALVPAGLAMFGLGGALRTWFRSLPLRLGSSAILRAVLDPFIAVGSIAALGATAVLSNAIGPLRSGLGLAAYLAALALLGDGNACRRFGRFSGFGSILWSAAGYGLVVVYAATAVATERLVPFHRVVTSSHPIVYHDRSERCTLVVTSGQNAYHLFLDDELRFSTFDERRWAESLVRPALARTREPKRALVLSTGEGLIERELLKDPAIRTITSVVRCGLLPALARRSAWLGQLTDNAMNSPRVRLVERDPAAFLVDDEAEPYDIVIVDLPDPAGPRESKYYSRYFYRRVAAHLHDSSVLTVQATSARRSPRTFATIGATLQSAGFETTPEVVPLISRGEWTLYLASKGAIPPRHRPEWSKDSLEGTIPGQFTHLWPDALPPPDFVPSPSFLYDAKVLDWFERESEPGVAAEGNGG